MNTINNIRLHVEKKINDAKMEEFPFPHLIIENFFPTEIYDKILRYNLFAEKPGEEWITKKKSRDLKTTTPYHARKQINLDLSLESIDKEKSEFWKDIRDCFLNDRWFLNLIYKKYPAYFNIRFGDFVNDSNFEAAFKKELFLQRHEVGYNIGPHTDIPRRVITCIFSFASEKGFDEFGTELCIPRNSRIRCWGNDHYTMENFDVVKVAPYIPNNFLLFFKTRQSFHSVKEINNSVPNQRYGMQFQMYEPEQGVFTDLSAPGLMSSQHVEKSNLKRILNIWRKK